MIDIIVPVEGEGTQAVVARWLKAVGDTVVEHEPLVELETDKVTVEVNASVAGVIESIAAAEGAEVGPGAVLGVIAAGASASKPAPAGAPTAPVPPTARNCARCG